MPIGIELQTPCAIVRSRVIAFKIVLVTHGSEISPSKLLATHSKEDLLGHVAASRIN